MNKKYCHFNRVEAVIMNVLNNPLIDEIYELRKQYYVDIRHINTINAMTKRINTIEGMMRSIPEASRNTRNLRYRRLYCERRFLLWKKVIYASSSTSVMFFEKFELQLSQKSVGETAEQKESLKKSHLLPLLNLELLEKTDEQLREIILAIRAS